MEFDAKTKITPGSWYEKPTSLQTTKRAVMQAMNLRCDRTHRHCQLEGQVPGFGISRTSFLEDYQPCLAATMAAALAVPESAVFWEDALAVNEDKLIHGKMIQLLTETRLKLCVQSSVCTETLDTQLRQPLLRCWRPEALHQQFWKLHALFSAMLASNIGSPIKWHQPPPK